MYAPPIGATTDDLSDLECLNGRFALCAVFVVAEFFV